MDPIRQNGSKCSRTLASHGFGFDSGEGVDDDGGLMATGGLSPGFSSSTICYQQEEEEAGGERIGGGEGNRLDRYCYYGRLVELKWQPHLLQRQGRWMGAPPVGLKNLGNTCYLNSVLQCLTYTPPLANFCLQFLHSSICEKLHQQGDHPDKGKKRRDCPFCILEKRIARSLSLDATSDVPSKVNSSLRLYASHFQWGHQEDAHEFLRYVLDSCHNTCLELLNDHQHQSRQLGGVGGGVTYKKSRNNTSTSSSGTTSISSGSSLKATTVVEDIFGGALLSQVRCLSCGFISSKIDQIMDVNLNLFQSRSLYDAFDRFFEPELLDGDNKYNCSKCCKLSAAKKHMFLQQAPNVLVIQLKRFEGINGIKINRDIAFEEVLSLSNFTSNASQDYEPVYNLFGSIVHSGYSPDSGHYYAYVKDPSGHWYCCNDSNVSLSSSQEVLSEKAYILFYVRNNQGHDSVKPAPSCNDQKLPESNGNHIGIPKPSKKSKGEFGLNSEKIPSSVVKDNKVAPSQPIKFSFKSFQKSSYSMQENYLMHGKRDSKCSDDAQINRGSGSKQLPLSEKNIAMSQDVPHCSIQANGLSHSDGQLASGDVSLMGNSKITQGMVDGFIKSKARSPLSDDIKEFKSNGSHVFKPKRMLDAKDSSAVIPYSKCSISDVVKEDVSYASCSIFFDKISPEVYARIKDRISHKACMKLQSCGWIDEVYDFMRARKRICVKAADYPPDHTMLRRLLISDAKNNLLSHIPQELKEDLLKDLWQLFFETDS